MNQGHRPIPRKTLAQELADTLTEEIVAGSRKPGDTLPTEPELSKEFQVSRSVVRDATRILSARGLVEVHHGKGAYVTESQLDAFGEALFLALRREHASVWDVEEFFLIVWPEVFAMVSERATKLELDEIRRSAESYLDVFRDVVRKTTLENRESSEEEYRAIRDGHGAFLQAALSASHNKVFTLMFGPFEAVRSLRNWEAPNASEDELVHIESALVHRVIEALESRDPDAARSAVAAWFDLPAEAVEAMTETPVGQATQIPVSILDYARQRGLT
jgi:DNA-binding FadR family transcriptional regulator